MAQLPTRIGVPDQSRLRSSGSRSGTGVRLAGRSTCTAGTTQRAELHMAVSDSMPPVPDGPSNSAHLMRGDEVEIARLIYLVAEYRDRGDWESAAGLFGQATFETHYPAGYPGVGVPPEEVSARQPGTHGRQQGVAETA